MVFGLSRIQKSKYPGPPASPPHHHHADLREGPALDFRKRVTRCADLIHADCHIDSIISRGSSYSTLDRSLVAETVSDPTLVGRKAETYTKIVESLHHLIDYCDSQEKEELQGIQLSPARKMELKEAYSPAYSKLAKAANVDGFIISSEVAEVLDKLRKRDTRP